MPSISELGSISSVRTVSLRTDDRSKCSQKVGYASNSNQAMTMQRIVWFLAVITSCYASNVDSVTTLSPGIIASSSLPVHAKISQNVISDDCRAFIIQLVLPTSQRGVSNTYSAMIIRAKLPDTANINSTERPAFTVERTSEDASNLDADGSYPEEIESHSLGSLCLYLCDELCYQARDFQGCRNSLAATSLFIRSQFIRIHPRHTLLIISSHWMTNKAMLSITRSHCCSKFMRLGFDGCCKSFTRIACKWATETSLDLCITHLPRHHCCKCILEPCELFALTFCNLPLRLNLKTASLTFLGRTVAYCVLYCGQYYVYSVFPCCRANISTSWSLCPARRKGDIDGLSGQNVCVKCRCRTDISRSLQCGT